MTHPKIAYYKNEKIHYVDAWVVPPRCSLCDDILDGDYIILLDESELGYTGENICKKCFQSSIAKVNEK